MTGNTKTITEVKRDISLLLSEIHYVSDCILEFDKESQAVKIVVLVHEDWVEKSLIGLLAAFLKYGYKIVIRRDPWIMPF